MPQSVKMHAIPWLHTGSKMHACTSGHSLLMQSRQSTGPPEPDDVALAVALVVTPVEDSALEALDAP